MTCLEVEFTSRGNELGGDGLVPPNVYLSYMEHLRWEYVRRVIPEAIELFRGGHTFVIVAQTVEIHGDIGLAVPIRGTLWIGRTGRSSMDFHHVLVRVKDEALLASGNVTAVYLEPNGKPTGLPDFMRQVEPDPPVRIEQNRPSFGPAPAEPFTRDYRVRTGDIDLLGHMNQANYAAFYEDARQAAAARNAYGPNGLGIGRTRFMHIEYSRSAMPGENLTVATWLSGRQPLTFGFELRRDSTILSRSVVRV